MKDIPDKPRAKITLKGETLPLAPPGKPNYSQDNENKT